MKHRAAVYCCLLFLIVKVSANDEDNSETTTQSSSQQTSSTSQKSRVFESQIMYLPVIQAGDLINFKTAPCSCPSQSQQPAFQYKFTFDSMNNNKPRQRGFESSARQGRTGRHQDARRASLPLVTVGAKRYLFITSNKMRWLDSIQFCELSGMEPISLLTAEETQLLVQYIDASDFRSEAVWINGATSIGTGSGNYRWLTTGQPVVEQDIVMTLDTLRSPIKRCLVLKSGQLEAEYCDHSGFHFVCETRDIA